jgi:hypothetical protein
MLYTSNFSRYKMFDRPISISIYNPSFYKGETYDKLQPSKKLLFDYKNNKINEQQYTRIYNAEVLQHLDPFEVYEELNPDFVNSAILCYESAGDFCHRRIVATWMALYTGIAIKEFKYEGKLFNIPKEWLS